MDKTESRHKAIANVNNNIDILYDRCFFAYSAIDEYEKLLNEPNKGWDKNLADAKPLDTNFTPTPPHAAERALYWKQRAEGTNEDWQYNNMGDVWIDILGEPRWLPCCKYRPKPKTRTVYFALVRYQSCGLLVGLVNDSKEDIVTDSKVSMFKIIGAIEQREVECD